MNSFKTYSYSTGKTSLEKITGSLVFLIILALLFYLFFQLYKFLWFISPLLIITSLVLDKRALLDYLKNIGQQITQNPIGGLINAMVNLLGLPFVLIGVVLKSWTIKRISKMQNTQSYYSKEEDFTPYEEVEIKYSKPKQEKKSITVDSRYDDLFE